MKKLFTFLACALCAITADAYNYYANYVQLTAVPTGAGKVYVNTSAADENSKWADVSEFKYVSMYEAFYLNAKPEDGYQLAGFSKTTLDENSEPVLSYDLYSSTNPTSVNCNTSDVSNSDESKALNDMPLEPNQVFLAIFTHVKPSYLAQMDVLGKVSIDKVYNEVGETVTMTATPDTEFDPTAKFDYWVKASTGEKIYDNPLTVAVTGVETYNVHFTADKAQVVHFAEDGEYKLWYDDSAVNGHCFPDNVWNSTISLVDKNYTDESDASNNNTTGKTYANVEEVSHYMWTSHTACLLYGKGDATIIVSGDTENDVQENDDKDVAYTKEALSVSDLPVTYKYYSIDIPKQVFRLLDDDAEIPANSFYIQFDAEGFSDEEYPEMMYWSAEAAVADGIDAAKVSETVKNGKVYNLGGAQVKSAGKGVYIMDGKKFINK